MKPTDHSTDNQKGNVVDGPEQNSSTLLNSFLNRRLSNAQVFLDATEQLEGYHHHRGLEESLLNCKAIIRQIHQQNQVCFHLRVDLEHMAQQRRECYEGSSTSLKGVANELWQYIVHTLKERTLTYQLIRVISIRLRAQHPLPLPEEVSGTSAGNRMETYQNSYKALAELFRVLVGTLHVIHFEAEEARFDHDNLWLLLQKAQMVDAQTTALIEEVSMAHQQRLDLFGELISGTQAILRRVERIYGSDHATVRRMIRYKL